jgi:hypothetical protein
VIVAAFIGRLKVAVINFPPALPGLPVLVVTNWLPLVGSVKVTVGIVGPAAAHTPPGGIAPAGMPAELPAAMPRIWPCPPPPPHPATKAVNNNAMNHISGLAGLLAAPPVTLSNLLILFSSLFDQKSIGAIDRPLAGTYPDRATGGATSWTTHWLWCATLSCFTTMLASVLAIPIQNRINRNQVTRIVLFNFRPPRSVR